MTWTETIWNYHKHRGVFKQQGYGPELQGALRQEHETLLLQIFSATVSVINFALGIHRGPWHFHRLRLASYSGGSIQSILQCLTLYEPRYTESFIMNTSNFRAVSISALQHWQNQSTGWVAICSWNSNHLEELSDSILMKCSDKITAHRSLSFPGQVDLWSAHTLPQVPAAPSPPILSFAI